MQEYVQEAYEKLNSFRSLFFLTGRKFSEKIFWTINNERNYFFILYFIKEKSTKSYASPFSPPLNFNFNFNFLPWRKIKWNFSYLPYRGKRNNTEAKNTRCCNNFCHRVEKLLDDWSESSLCFSRLVSKRRFIKIFGGKNKKLDSRYRINQQFLIHRLTSFQRVTRVNTNYVIYGIFSSLLPSFKVGLVYNAYRLLFYLLDRFTLRSISESSVIRDAFQDTGGFVSMENWKIEVKLKNR